MHAKFVWRGVFFLCGLRVINVNIWFDICYFQRLSRFLFPLMLRTCDHIECPRISLLPIWILFSCCSRHVSDYQVLDWLLHTHCLYTPDVVWRVDLNLCQKKPFDWSINQRTVDVFSGHLVLHSLLNLVAFCKMPQSSLEFDFTSSSPLQVSFAFANRLVSHLDFCR